MIGVTERRVKQELAGWRPRLGAWTLRPAVHPRGRMAPESRPSRTWGNLPLWGRVRLLRVTGGAGKGFAVRSPVAGERTIGTALHSNGTFDWGWVNGRVLWLAGAAIFGMLTAWASLHTLFPGEQEVARWLQRRRDTPGLLGYEEFADIIGMRATLYFLSAFGLLGFLVLRKWSLAALVVIAPALTLVGVLVKVAIRRPRPSADEVIALREIRSGYSFPSGHSLQAAIICVVAIIIAQQMLHGRLRLAVQAVAVWLATTIGWERVFDGGHWPTDVVGGFLLGVLATSAAWYGITQFGARRGTAAGRGDAHQP